jgi:hypothetical protein
MRLLPALAVLHNARLLAGGSVVRTKTTTKTA